MLKLNKLDVVHHWILPVSAIALAPLTFLESAIASPAPELQARLFSDIAFEYAELGNSERAIATAQKAIQSANAMTQPCYKANSLAKVAGSYLLAGQEKTGKQWIATAIQTARQQTATGCSSSATSPTESLANRAQEYAEDGHFDLAIALSSGLNDPMATAETAQDLFQAGQTERATQTLDQAIAFAQAITDATYRTQMLNLMATRLIAAGNREAGIRVLEQIDTRSTATSVEARAIQGNTRLWTARQFAAAGAPQRAIAILDQTLPTIRQLPSQMFPLDRIIQFVDAALLYRQLNRPDQATAILAEAYRAAMAIAPDTPMQSQADALGRVAVGYGKVGDFARARQIIQTIRPSIQRQAALGNLASVYVEAGNVEEAIKLAQSNTNRNGVLISIVRYYLQQKQPDVAWNFVQAQQVKGILSEVAVGYLEAGQPEKALQIVQTGNLTGFTPDIVQGYTQTGRSQQATSLIEAQGLTWLLPTVVQGLAEQGQFDAALQTAQFITDPTQKAEALIAIARVYAEPTTASGDTVSWLTDWRDLFQSILGDSKREKAQAVLDQALQIATTLGQRK
jgi:tetratricopeptide (TPR) repeat protein